MVEASASRCAHVAACGHSSVANDRAVVNAGLREHLAEKKLKARGGVWEVYWTDPGMVPDQSKWTTQLFAPIE